ncbi:MAG: GGDEF domain-containing protein [Deltaproteobacteria bacterium]|nr:GGDEF domain-containing protein [Deltaproteobacteria bacterium]
MTAESESRVFQRVTSTSLADQMQITEREIDSRKRLLGFSGEDELLLKECRPLIAKRLDSLVEEFYEHQTGFSDIALLIGDSESLQRLRASMRRYILELFDGFYDADYVNRRLRIGKVHKRIGVPPKLYISAVFQLESLLRLVLGEGKAGGTSSGAKEIQKKLNALRKILMFDLQLVFDTYINSLVAEVETAKDEVEKYALSLEDIIEERTRQLDELSRKDVLTGLGNQRDFNEQLRRMLSQAERESFSLTLAYFDLNGFKGLNDSEGHQAGDRLLALVGKSVLESIRIHDVGVRYGGDEFCIIMQNTNLKQSRVVVDRLIEKFSKANKTPVSFSVGLVQTGPESYLGLDELVKEADKNMYAAKKLSKKKPGFYVVP